MFWRVLVACVLIALLASLCAGLERVSDYASPTDFNGWNQNTYYLSNPSGSQLVVSTTQPNTPTLAVAVNNYSMTDLGWDYFSVKPAASFWSEPSRRGDGYYHAGFIEGFVTIHRIHQVFGASGNNYTTNSKTLKWIEDHIKYMNETSTSQRETSEYWNTVHSLLRQLEGIVDGYNAAALHVPSRAPITFLDIFKLNFLVEYEGVEEATGTDGVSGRSFKSQSRRGRGRRPSKDVLAKIHHGEHCSALIKHVGDDIFFSHVTWSGFTDTVRQYKSYQFATTVTMSSYAGFVASVDDFYMTSPAKMGVMETTNDFYNDTLATLYIVPNRVSEFIRVMTSNYLAQNGPHWVDTYQTHNSGTYCNQWMILDMKLFTPNQPLPDNFFWLAEQMPGNVTSADMTWKLRADSYWPSYNVPYFPNIYNASGFLPLLEEYGPFWGYKTYARAEIFARNETRVNDLKSMMAMMRYNNWETDPLSTIKNCSVCNPKTNPLLAVAARGDLVPEDAVLPPGDYADYFTRGAFGGIDAKISSAKMVLNDTQNGWLINGPTAAQQPPFSWDFDPSSKPPGAPQVYDYDWIRFYSPPLDVPTSTPTPLDTTASALSSEPASSAPQTTTPSSVPPKPTSAPDDTNPPLRNMISVTTSSSVSWYSLRSTLRDLICGGSNCPGYRTGVDIVADVPSSSMGTTFTVGLNSTSMLVLAANVLPVTYRSFGISNISALTTPPSKEDQGPNLVAITTLYEKGSGAKNAWYSFFELRNFIFNYLFSYDSQEDMQLWKLTCRFGGPKETFRDYYRCTWIVGFSATEQQVEVSGIDWQSFSENNFDHGGSSVVRAVLFPPGIDLDKTTLRALGNRLHFRMNYSRYNSRSYMTFRQFRKNLVTSVNLNRKSNSPEMKQSDVRLAKANSQGKSDGTVVEQFTVGFSSSEWQERVLKLYSDGKLDGFSSSTKFVDVEVAASPGDALTESPAPPTKDNDSKIPIWAGIAGGVVLVALGCAFLWSRSKSKSRRSAHFDGDINSHEYADSFNMEQAGPHHRV